MAKTSNKKAPPARAEPVLEWIVAALGLVVTVAVLAVIGWEATQPQTPPAFRLTAAQPHTTASGWTVEVEVRNTGRATAAEVVVEGALSGPSPEVASATLPYVPGRGVQTVTLGFSTDPSQGRLRLIVRGWSEP